MTDLEIVNAIHRLLLAVAAGCGVVAGIGTAAWAITGTPGRALIFAPAAAAALFAAAVWALLSRRAERVQHLEEPSQRHAALYRDAAILTVSAAVDDALDHAPDADADREARWEHRRAIAARAVDALLDEPDLLAGLMPVDTTSDEEQPAAAAPSGAAS